MLPTCWVQEHPFLGPARLSCTKCGVCQEQGPGGEGPWEGESLQRESSLGIREVSLITGAPTGSQVTVTSISSGAARALSVGAR